MAVILAAHKIRFAGQLTHPLIHRSRVTSATPKPLLEGLATNSEASKSSPAAAASLANVGRVYSPQELADLVQKDKHQGVLLSQFHLEQR